MRPTWLFAIAAAAVAMDACSSASMPSVQGDCRADAGCGYSSSGGGGSGSGGSDAGGGEGGTCTADPTTSQCDQCVDVDCCADLHTCGTDTSCENLLACVSVCGTQSCENDCVQKYREASGVYEALVSCISVKCAVCSQSGVGDPCTAASNACTPGLTCTGLWCTRACAKASDCAGLGAGGGNFDNQPSACLRTSSGYSCFPGCSTDTDCADFPGTYCSVTMNSEGAMVQVCTSLPDSGAGPG